MLNKLSDRPQDLQFDYERRSCKVVEGVRGNCGISRIRRVAVVAFLATDQIG